MAQEFKVIRDTSLQANNDPKALEKKMTEMSRAGWTLMHVTSVTESGSDNIVTTSHIYLFWQREAAVVAENEDAVAPLPDKRIFR